MSKAGLLFVYSNKKEGSKWNEDAYHKWYKQHLKYIINIKESGAPLSAMRYKVKNANDQAKHHLPFVALYPLSDTNFITTAGFKEQPVEGVEELDVDVRLYEEVQRFVPGTGEKANGKRGACVVAVGMTPGGGDAGEHDFEDWYRKQHLDMLSMVTGYLRTTRYRLLRDDTKDFAQLDDSVLDGIPKYLALHEYEGDESTLEKVKGLALNGSKATGPPPEQLKQVVSTQWSKKIIAEAEKFEREVLELFDEEVKEGETQAHL